MKGLSLLRSPSRSEAAGKSLEHEHAVARIQRPGHWFCNACRKKSTSNSGMQQARFRCSENCDFDLCESCFKKWEDLRRERQEATAEADAFLKMPRPDGQPCGLGTVQLDEPALNSYDPFILDLKLVQAEVAAAVVEPSERPPEAEVAAAVVEPSERPPEAETDPAAITKEPELGAAKEKEWKKDAEVEAEVETTAEDTGPVLVDINPAEDTGPNEGNIGNLLDIKDELPTKVTDIVEAVDKSPRAMVGFCGWCC